MRDRFINPASGVSYSFQVNHDEEDEMGKARAITRLANTGLVGAVRQQGDDGPLLLRWSGKILHREQYRQMWAWFALSRNQTIHIEDFDGQKWEVQITSFQPKRVRKLSYSGKDPSMPHHYYTYRLEMEVYGFISGDMVTAGVTL